MLTFHHTHRHWRLDSHRRGSRFVAAMAVVLLVGQVGTLAHRFLVRHATCVEHGEPIHATNERRENRAAPRDPDGAEVRSSETSSSVHGDEHCPIAVHQGRVSLDGPRIARPAEPATQLLAPLADEASTPPSVALFLLAPKNSPPA